MSGGTPQGSKVQYYMAAVRAMLLIASRLAEWVGIREKTEEQYCYDRGRGTRRGRAVAHWWHRVGRVARQRMGQGTVSTNQRAGKPPKLEGSGEAGGSSG